MQEAVKGFVARRKENGLFVVDMPTGSGKTYYTARLIKQFIEGDAFPDIRKVIYLTPLNKNVKDALEEVRKITSPKLFDKSVLLIQANFQCVVDHFLEVEGEMPPIIREKDSRKNLHNYIETLKQQKEIGSDLNQTYSTQLAFEDQIRRVYEPAFRRDIKALLDKNGNNKREKLGFIKKNWPWLLKLYPAILTEYRKVLFMSVDKFCSGNDPIIAKPYGFSTASWVKGALVFIDEFDASKEFILRSQIEDSLKTKIDLIKLFSTMSAAFAADRRFPKENFPEPVDGNEKHGSAYIFERMKSIVLERRKELNLNYPFKLDTQDDKERMFLFDDFSLHTISSTNKTKKPFVRNDTERNQNVITIEEETNDDGNFYRMVSGLNGALSFSVTAYRWLAENYLAYYNEKKRGEFGDQMELDQAVSTMLFPIELDSSLELGLKRMILSSNPRKPKKTRNAITSDFYAEGFRYYDFLDDPSHDTVTIIEMCSLNETPEKFLVDLASNSLVVGLSATATIDTVTGNYNHDYLVAKLGDAFCEPTREDRERMSAANEERDSIADYPIEVKSFECEGDDLEEIASSVFSVKDNVEDYLVVLGSVAKKPTSTLFDEKRYTKLVKAIKQFILNPKGQAMLALCNNNLRISGEAAYSMNAIRRIVSNIQTEVGDGRDIKVHALFGNTFERERELYRKEIQNGAKVILFSSYPSAGTGQNLQYSIMEGPDQNSEMEKDIDTVYLENPTHILVNVSSRAYDDETPLSEADLIKYVYQIESLRTRGEIDHEYASGLIKNAFKVFMRSNPGVRGNKEYKTPSVNNHRIRTLEQAVGRICRTRDETKKGAFIYVDEEIFQKCDFSQVLGKMMNKEFREIIKNARNTVSLPDETKMELNRAQERCQRLESAINKLMGDNAIDWRPEKMAEWNEIRVFLLKNPTIRGAIPSRYADFYLQSTKGKSFNRYFFGGSNGSYRISYREDQESRKEVSQSECNLEALMKIPHVGAKFQEMGYATAWEKGDAVINPVAYINLYKGALGEQAGRAILERHGIRLEEIVEGDKFEKFDFRVEGQPNLYVDFKNWCEWDMVSREEQQKKIARKLDLIGGKKAFIINLVIAGERKPHNSSKIYECPGLVLWRDNAHLYEDGEQIKRLVAAITEAKEDGHN